MAKKKVVDVPSEFVTAKEDFRAMFGGHSLSFKEGQEIEPGPLAEYLIDSNAPVDVPEGYKRIGAVEEEEHEDVDGEPPVETPTEA